MNFRVIFHYDISLLSGTYKLKDSLLLDDINSSYPLISCYLTTRHQFLLSISSMVLSLFHGSTWSDPLCQGHCVYFAVLIATIHYSKQPMVDSRKFEGYCVYLREAVVFLLF